MMLDRVLTNATDPVGIGEAFFECLGVDWASWHAGYLDRLSEFVALRATNLELALSGSG